MSVFLLTPKFSKWWTQFPLNLRLIAKARFIASLGAGGVIYLTPLVFNQLDLSAMQIGSGIAIAGLSGAITRLITGRLLDLGLRHTKPIQLAAVVAIIADLILFKALSFQSYLLGQIFLGLAAGLYWPAAELAIPICCENYPSNQGFALARTADALGTSLGTGLGSITAALASIRCIYIIDILFMAWLFFHLQNKLLRIITEKMQSENRRKELERSNSRFGIHLVSILMPILCISILATGIFSLLQSALPLDLVTGGIVRPALSNFWSSILIAIQLFLIVIFQWPIGKWLSNYKSTFGLEVSVKSFGIGCILIAISSLLPNGIYLIIMAQIPIAIGITSYLPTAPETVIRVCPKENRGLGIALLSQCFALSSLISPLLTGFIIDLTGNAMYLWLIIGIICAIAIRLVNQIKVI